MKKTDWLDDGAARPSLRGSACSVPDEPLPRLPELLQMIDFFEQAGVMLPADADRARGLLLLH